MLNSECKLSLIREQWLAFEKIHRVGDKITFFYLSQIRAVAKGFTM